MSSVYLRSASIACAVLVLAGCAVRKPAAITEGQPEAPPKPVACVPAKAGDPMIGTWLSNTRPRDVSGELQSLIVLSADGTMAYESLLKIGRKARPALRETGCWAVADNVYTMQTTKSAGEPVDAKDPIYVSRYRVEKVERAKLTLRELKSGGQLLTARRMPQGYRLPY
ncbi:MULTISPECIES: hypothetical protein [Achromobacter]|uniref:Lipoprotein n=1 Tax=Achromobacter spanius TaxID=217203 RepID=A0ABY8GRE8_9BURK|nr:MULTISPECIES: hypothetical protein [Achromobacter]WAI83608.1 hypothetical protein N8Z00_00580 [Achromobacter spanius]WEX93691.1 hypothetical protein N3Z32_24350 [Achromobacter sp. SS2-2022]WFP07148.1 hypothetical protein P8T11_22905 [Achromobacter spanius]